jgi:hypothetical protein
MEKKGHKLIDIISPFVIALIFSPWLIFLYLYLSNYSLKLDINDQEFIKGFIEWFGTAYGLFLALVLVNVWEQFGTVEREFDREVDALSMLLQTISYIQLDETQPNKNNLTVQLKKIKFDLARYVRHVINNAHVEHITKKALRTGNKILEEIGQSVGQLANEKNIPEPVIYEMFINFREAMDVRGDRISHAKQKIPLAVQSVAIVSSIVWLASFFSQIVYDVGVVMLLIGGVSFVIVMIIIIIGDLNNPFSGIWMIDIDSWFDFLERVDPSIIFVYNINNNFIDHSTHLLAGKWPTFRRCSLRMTTHDRLNERDPWVALRKKINKVSNVKVLFRNQKKDIDYPVDFDTPVILYQFGHVNKELVKKNDLNSYKDFNEFEQEFLKKLRTEGLAI